MTKTVTISIDPNDLSTLRPEGGNPYNLCFARKVGDKFNVVWQSSDDYGPNNDFSWDPVFQLFASNTFEAGLKVVVTSNKVPIALGQQSTLDNRIVLTSPAVDQVAPGVDPLSIRMVNEYGAIHAGLAAQSTFGGKTTFTPVFISPDQDVAGKVMLTPKEVVRVWFQRDIETSTMLESSVSRGIDIDLTHDDAATRLYKGGKWSTPAPAVLVAYAAQLDGPTILQIVFAISGLIVANNVINTIRNYVMRTYPNVEVSGKVDSSGTSFTMKYFEKPLAGVYATQQLLALGDAAAFRQALVDAAITALGTNKVTWTEMDVKVG